MLGKDTVGRVLLLAAAVLALVLAYTGALGFYDTLRNFTFGPKSLRLNLRVGAWAADGLMAIFVFVIGLELRKEFVEGKLRDIRPSK
jgi:NhaA family Na+:H+ antiporter